MRDLSLTPAPLPAVRALTELERRAVVETVLNAWTSVPHLRLGQLISCALGNENMHLVSDEDLSVAIAVFAHRLSGK